MKMRRILPLSCALTLLVSLCLLPTAQADHTIHLPLSIAGEGSFLPDRIELAGDVYFADSNFKVGTYQETSFFTSAFTASGEATFVFKVGRHVLGTLTTADDSVIVGQSGNVLFVESTGVVTSGTGIFSDVVGGLCSSSKVIVNTENPAVFVLDTDLVLTLSGD